MENQTSRASNLRENEKFLTLDQMAKRWDLAPSTLREAVNSGALPSRQVGRTHLVDYCHAVAWIAAHNLKPKKALSHDDSDEPSNRKSKTKAGSARTRGLANQSAIAG